MNTFYYLQWVNPYTKHDLCVRINLKRNNYSKDLTSRTLIQVFKVSLRGSDIGKRLLNYISESVNLIALFK